MIVDLLSLIEQSLKKTWTGWYVRFLAVLLAYGALMHIGNILGWSGRTWIETPIHWRVMDVVLLGFNVVVGVGLWLRAPWAVVAFALGILAFQLIPYTIFRQYFGETPEQLSTLNGLVVTWIVLLAVLALLVVPKR